MTEKTDFPVVATIYMKPGCPFCFRVRLFLLEAGLLDRVRIVEGATAEEQAALTTLLDDVTGKASFPTAEISPGEYLPESGALIAHFAEAAGVDPERMPTYQAYLAGVFLQLQTLFVENVELKKKLESPLGG